MRTSGRAAEHVELDHGDWVEDPPRRARSGGDRRATERRGQRRQGAGPRAPLRRAPRERAALLGERRRARGAGRRGAARTADPARDARPPAGVLGPGVAERRTLMLVTFLLVVYGLVMAYSASAAQAYFEHGSSFYYVRPPGRLWVCHRRGRHVRTLARGLRLVPQGRRAARRAGLRRPGRSSSCRASAASINGARRWIFLGGQGLQPSEFAKLACVALVATLIVARPREVLTLKGFLRLAVIGIVPAAALIMLEPDLGTTLVLVTAVVAVLVAAGAPLRYLCGLPSPASSPSCCSSPQSRTGWSG